MGRDVIDQKFEEYLQEMMEYARQELVEGHLNPLRSRELYRIKQAILRQHDAVLDCVEALADGAEEPSEEHVERFVENSPFLRYYHGSDPDGLKQELEQQFREMVVDLVPIVQEDADSFDDALRNAYPDRDEAHNVLRENFRHVDLITDYTDGMDVKLGPFTVVDFSEEIQPVIMEGEERLEEEMDDDLDEIYGA